MLQQVADHLKLSYIKNWMAFIQMNRLTWTNQLVVLTEEVCTLMNCQYQQEVLGRVASANQEPSTFPDV